MRPSQPQVVRPAECSPGRSGNDSERSEFKTSTPQELSYGVHTSSQGGDSPSRSPLLDLPSHLEPSASTSSRYSAEHQGGRDESLHWFDLMATPPVESTSSVLVSPGPKTSEENMVEKISNNKVQSKSKRKPRQRNSLEAKRPPSPGETETAPRRGKGESKKAEKVAPVSVATIPAGEPDLALTHQVPKKLHTLPRKKQAQEHCRSPARVPSTPPDPSHSQSIPVHSPERTLETPKRKRSKSLAQEEEPELESVENPSAPLTKLAKFTFKQKSKLTHSPEDHNHVSTDTVKTAVHSPKVSQCKPKEEAAVSVQVPEAPASPSGAKSSTRLRGKAKGQAGQPPEDRSKEKVQCVPEESVSRPKAGPGSVPGHCPAARERGKQEEVSSERKSGKVHARTIAKLANFCFTSPSESKSESKSGSPPPLPESKNWSGSRPSAPPTTAATVLGSNRKSFQLGSTERMLLPQNPLFTLPELDDEALDFDWDEEMKKKP